LRNNDPISPPPSAVGGKHILRIPFSLTTGRKIVKIFLAFSQKSGNENQKIENFLESSVETSDEE
jgi:hypothetical protein